MIRDTKTTFGKTSLQLELRTTTGSSLVVACSYNASFAQFSLINF